jgi:hypothetical protein
MLMTAPRLGQDGETLSPISLISTVARLTIFLSGPIATCESAMVKPKNKKPKNAVAIQNITPERAARLFQLVSFLGRGVHTRAGLTRTLRLTVRGFYRDLEVLRTAGIGVHLATGRYSLDDNPAVAIERLPFPDPGLTLGEARQLARGRSRVHKKLRDQLARIEK